MTFSVYDEDLGKAAEEVSDTSLTIQPTSLIPVGKLAILVVVSDNASTTNGDDTTIITATDTKSNTWTRAGEGQYSAGGVLDGVLVGIYYSVITTQLETTDTITLTWSANATGKGCQLSAWNRDTAKTIAVAGKAYQRVAAASSYTVTLGSLTNEEHLWIATNGIELPQGATNGSDASWGFFLGAGSNNWGGSTGTFASARAGHLVETGTTQTYDRATLDTADRATVIVAFREVAGAATVMRRALLGVGV